MENRTFRLNRLLTLLQEHKTLSVKALASALGVSDMTIRRDLSLLHQDGLVYKKHGSAMLSDADDGLDALSEHNRYDLFHETVKMGAEKDRIGAFAATLVGPGDVIIIDTGTTTDRLAKHIPGNADVTALCFSYNVLNHLIHKPSVKLIFSGGFYHPNGQIFESAQGVSLIESVRASKVFVSASGIHDQLGITCSNNYEVSIKRASIKSSQMKILLLDSSKFGVIKPAYFAQLNEVDAIVTDSGIDAGWKEQIESLGIQLHIV